MQCDRDYFRTLFRRLKISGRVQGAPDCRCEIALTGIAAQMSPVPKSHRLSWYLLNAAGAAAILFGSFFVTLKLLDAADVMAEARRGGPVEIRFDAKVCRAGLIGNLQCAIPYYGRYTPATNTWVVTGRLGDQPYETTSPPYDNAPKEPGNISVFGALFKFDRAGKLSLPSVDAGTVAPSRPFWQRAFSLEK